MFKLTFWFCSEESGYSHLYVADPTTGTKKALTKGEFEIYNPAMSRDKKSWTFTANNVHPGVRHFYRMPLEGGQWQQLTNMEGRNDAVISPNGKKLALRRWHDNQYRERCILCPPIDCGTYTHENTPTTLYAHSADNPRHVQR